MAQGIHWPGANTVLGPPKGVEEAQCSSLPVFRNGAVCVSCWEFTDDEIAEIVRTKRVFLSIWMGATMPPALVGTEDIVRGVVADFGAVWPKERA